MFRRERDKYLFCPLKLVDDKNVKPDEIENMKRGYFDAILRHFNCPKFTNKNYRKVMKSECAEDADIPANAKYLINRAVEHFSPTSKSHYEIRRNKMLSGALTQALKLKQFKAMMLTSRACNNSIKWMRKLKEIGDRYVKQLSRDQRKVVGRPIMIMNVITSEAKTPSQRVAKKIQPATTKLTRSSLSRFSSSSRIDQLEKEDRSIRVAKWLAELYV